MTDSGPAGADRFAEAFARLRAILLAAVGPGHAVTRDAVGELVVRTQERDPKTGEPGWFAMVAVKKSYVSYHLMPLYVRPDLASDLPAALEKRRQGKTCFNFKAVDEPAFDALARLTRSAAGV
jgi:hypothetical protein